MRVVFPAPFGPSRPKIGAPFDGQVDPLQGLGVRDLPEEESLSAVEDPGNPVGLDGERVVRHGVVEGSRARRRPY